MKHLHKILSESSKSELITEEWKMLCEGFSEHGVSPEQYKLDLANHEANYNGEDLHRHVIKHISGDISHVTREQKHAIGEWTTRTYRDMNKAKKGLIRSPYHEELANHLETAINNHKTAAATWLYRGVRHRNAAKLNSLKPGDTFHNAGFASMTVDPNRATHFAKGEDIMALHLPAGSHALYTSHPKLNSWEEEREFTLPPGTHMRHHGHSFIEAPEHHYTGAPTGAIKRYKLHHVELIPPSKGSIEIDRHE